VSGSVSLYVCLLPYLLSLLPASGLCEAPLPLGHVVEGGGEGAGGCGNVAAPEIEIHSESQALGSLDLMSLSAHWH
jgi:hypothetical protein